MEEEIGKGARQDSEAVLFVDIGGATGYEGLALKKRYPNLPGRLCQIRNWMVLDPSLTIFSLSSQEW